MAGRAFSVIFLFAIGAIAIAYAGLLVLVEDADVPSLTADRGLSAAVLGVLGAVCFLIGLVVAFTGKPKAPPVVVAGAAPQAKPETVTVKRTQMDWGTGGGQPAGDDLETKLEDVNRRLGRLKVQLGLGEISNEGYKAMSAELEKERVQIELTLRKET